MNNLNPKEKAVLKLIKEDPTYKNYFFERVRDLKWFDALKSEGYFNPENNPEPTKVKGGFQINMWEVLPYLEKVAEQTADPKNEVYIKELLQIIKDASEYKKNGEFVDNYRTGWFFVKILLHFPTSKIPLEVLQLIPIWLKSRYEVSLQGADLIEKLLPKFLSSTDPIDIQKAQLIVSFATDLKWERRKSAFGYNEDPRTIVAPHWLVQSLITKKRAESLGEICSIDFVYRLADKLKNAFRLRYKNHYIESVEKSSIYRMSADFLRDETFDVSIGRYKRVEGKLIVSLDEESLDIEQIAVFRLDRIKNEIQFVEELNKQLNELKINAKIKENLQNLSKPFYRRIFQEYSYIWIKSLTKGHNHDSTDTFDTLTLILRDILIGMSKKNTVYTNQVITDFLGETYQYPLFRRVGFYVISENWDSYKKLFTDLLKSKGNELLDEGHYEVELYDLLKKNVDKFSQEERALIEAEIEKGPSFYLPKHEKEKYINFWKQKWYSAMKSDSQFMALYEKYRQKTKIQEKIFTESEYVTTGWGKSPLSLDQIVGMSNVELSQYLASFKTKDPFKKSPEALADTLKEAVEQNAKKYVDDLEPFLKVGYKYMYHLLWAIKDSWSAHNTIDWSRLISFLKDYLSRDKYWQDYEQELQKETYHENSWTLGTFGELIQEGTRTDEWAFPEDLNSTVEKLLVFTLKKIKVDGNYDGKNAYGHSLNSTAGKLLTALIFLALRIARINRKNQKEEKWSEEVKNAFNIMLADRFPEAYALLGRYLVQIYFLDKEWTVQHIKELEKEKNNILWEAFMDGYLYIDGVYNDIYPLMRGNYKRAITHNFKDDRIGERLVQHIAIGYMRDEEALLSNSLFNDLINRFETSQILSVLRFFWQQREYISKESITIGLEEEKFRIKILEFWDWLYKRYTDKQNFTEDDKKILSSVSRLSVYISELGLSYYQKMKLSATYVTYSHNAPYFIEELDRLKDTGDKKSVSVFIGELFLQMLKNPNDMLPGYDSQDISDIVIYLYTAGSERAKELADEICVVYAKNNDHFLKEIYTKYH